MTMAKPAVFWDRDNTLIKDPGYISRPEQVKLIPGAGKALRRIGEAGFENIIATNQSGIARGKFDEERLKEIHERMNRLFATQQAKIDAIYYCPYLEGPEAKVADYRRESDLRKPKPGMLLQAALERNIDLAASWSIGDSIRDAEAGRQAGCRTILIVSDKKDDTAVNHKAVDFVAHSIAEAVDIVLKHTRQPEPDPPAEVVEAPAAKTEPTTGGADQRTALLQEILNFMRQVDRRNQSEDFSMGRLIGALVQMLAVAALIWAIFAMIKGGPSAAPTAIVRLLLAMVLQTMALTCFSTSSRK